MHPQTPAFLPYLITFWLLAGCVGLSWDTTVAQTPATRAAMAQSVRIGETTERGMQARWGNPFQKIEEGAQTEYVYRRLNGYDTAYVIVTFRHGVATGLRTSDDEGCRGTFAPRVPGYGFDTAEVVWPVGPCGPDAITAQTGGFQVRGADGLFGTSLFEDAGAEPGTTPTQTRQSNGPRPGVPADIYEGSGQTK
ncbi:MAG: hypothetical protein AAFS05_07900 [Pseudomonadota bacterium]